MFVIICFVVYCINIPHKRTIANLHIIIHLTKYFFASRGVEVCQPNKEDTKKVVDYCFIKVDGFFCGGNDYGFCDIRRCAMGG
jgi:hypothetical protein